MMKKTLVGKMELGWVFKGRDGVLGTLFCPTCGGQVFTCPDPACEGKDAHHVFEGACRDFDAAKLCRYRLSLAEGVAYRRYQSASMAFSGFLRTWRKDAGAKLEKELPSLTNAGKLDILLINRVESAMREAWMAAAGVAETVERKEAS